MTQNGEKLHGGIHQLLAMHLRCTASLQHTCSLDTETPMALGEGERERGHLERERERETQRRGAEMKGDDKLLLAAERYAWHTGALHVQPE